MTMALPTVWTLEDGLDIIRAIQPDTRKFGYHVCLGGGVLNKGSSHKDLDLYFLPMGGPKSNPGGLVKWLESMWSTSTEIGNGDYPAEPPYLHRLKFQYGELRIDVFVIGVEDSSETDQGEEAAEERPNPYWIGNPEPQPFAGVNVVRTYADIARAVTPAWRGRQWVTENENVPTTAAVQTMQADPEGPRAGRNAAAAFTYGLTPQGVRQGTAGNNPAPAEWAEIGRVAPRAIADRRNRRANLHRNWARELLTPITTDELVPDRDEG